MCDVLHYVGFRIICITRRYNKRCRPNGKRNLEIYTHLSSSAIDIAAKPLQDGEESGTLSSAILRGDYAFVLH